MTPNKVIEIVDRVKPNSYTDEDKLRWINELDGMVQRLVMKRAEVEQYTYPNDLDRELLIPAPYDEDLYTLYVQAKIDFYNREYTHYNNTATMFELRYDAYKKDYIRNHRAKG